MSRRLTDWKIEIKTHKNAICASKSTFGATLEEIKVGRGESFLGLDLQTALYPSKDVVCFCF